MKNFLFATVATAAVCLAQVPDAPTTSAPAVAATVSPTPHLLLDTVGPDGWRTRLGPTNLGSLLASEQGRALWQPNLLPMLGQVKAMLGDEAGAAAERRLLGHQGRIRIGVWLDFQADPPIEGMAMATLIESDGRTDLASLANDLRTLFAMVTRGAPSQLEIVGSARDVRRDQGETFVLPFVDGKHVMLAVGPEAMVPAVCAAMQKLGADATGKPPLPNTPAMRLQIDLVTLNARSLARLGRREAEMLREMGLASLGRMDWQIAAAGPHVEMELAVRFLSDERGVYSALLPATVGVPATHGLIPASAVSWKVGRCDFHVLYRTIVAAIAKAEEQTVGELTEEIRKDCGLDPDADLLAHTTDEVVFWHGPVGDFDRLSHTDWTLALGVRDRGAFLKGLTTLLPYGKPMLSRAETVDVDGVELHRYGIFGYDLWLAVGNEHFVVAGGEHAQADIEALLRAAAKAPAEASVAKSMTDLQRHLPPGCHGYAQSEIAAFVALPLDWWGMALREIGPMVPFRVGRLQDDDEARGKRRELLQAHQLDVQAHQLDVVRTATGYAERTWRWRLWW